MNLNGGLDGRFTQFPVVPGGGQAQPAGNFGLGPNAGVHTMQAGYSQVQNPLQQGRPGVPASTNPPTGLLNQRLAGGGAGLAPTTTLQQQQNLGRIAVPGQYTGGTGAGAIGFNAPLAGQLNRPVIGTSGLTSLTGFNLLQQQQQQQQQTRPAQGLVGIGGRIGPLSTASGTQAVFGAPSGDLISMLSKAGGRPEERPAFDASDFPSLSATGPGGGRPLSSDGGPDSFANLLAAQKPQIPATAPSFGEEDFPALPGAVGGRPDDVGQPFFGLNDPSLDVLRQQQVQRQIAQQAAIAAPRAGIVKPDRFGLLGLLSVVRMTDPDLSLLALGKDLTNLGLNLNDPDCLWKTQFSTPWTEAPPKPDIDTRTPACYLFSPQRLTPTQFQKFQPDTLFYIFYGMPGDEMQAFAADELSSRGWYFHKEYRAWLTRAPNTEPVQKTERFERGSFFVFDPAAWEVVRKDNLVVEFASLERAPGMTTRQQPPPGVAVAQ